MSAAPTPVRIGPAAGLDQASVFYGEVVGLSRVSLEIHRGITGIVGPNGSGKSTLMRVLVGLLQPQEGAVSVLGGNPFFDADVRNRISFVPATECFHENLSGVRNLVAAFSARGHGQRRSRGLAAEALELVGLTADGGRPYRTWSRGMRQRLKLGLALASASDLVLLDEPFLGVDPPSRRELRDYILKLGEDRAVLISSHVLHEVEALTDRVGVLAHGRLLGFGRVEALLEDLREVHPRRMVLEADDPRRLGAALLELPHVLEIVIAGDAQMVFVTDDPDNAYRDLARIVVDTGVVVRSLRSADNGLEAVFTHVTATGTRRL